MTRVTRDGRITVSFNTYGFRRLGRRHKCHQGDGTGIGTSSGLARQGRVRTFWNSGVKTGGSWLSVPFSVFPDRTTRRELGVGSARWQPKTGSWPTHAFRKEIGYLAAGAGGWTAGRSRPTETRGWPEAGTQTRGRVGRLASPCLASQASPKKEPSGSIAATWRPRVCLIDQLRIPKTNASLTINNFLLRSVNIFI